MSKPDLPPMDAAGRDRWRKQVFKADVESMTLLFLLAVYEYTSWKTGNGAYPSDEQIASDMKCSVRTVMRARKAAISSGWIAAWKERDGRFLKWHYALVQPDNLTGDSATRDNLTPDNVSNITGQSVTYHLTQSPVTSTEISTETSTPERTVVEVQSPLRAPTSETTPPTTDQSHGGTSGVGSEATTPQSGHAMPMGNMVDTSMGHTKQQEVVFREEGQKVNASQGSQEARMDDAATAHDPAHTSEIRGPQKGTQEPKTFTDHVREIIAGRPWAFGDRAIADAKRATMYLGLTDEEAILYALDRAAEFDTRPLTPMQAGRWFSSSKDMKEWVERHRAGRRFGDVRDGMCDYETEIDFSFEEEGNAMP